MTQKEQIAAHLKAKGWITPLEALNEYGCFRLAARISELREDGMAILTFREPGKKFARYVRFA